MILNLVVYGHAPLFINSRLSSDDRPFILWCLYFNMADGSALEEEGHRLPCNVFMCSGPDGSLGHEHSIKQVSPPPCAEVSTPAAVNTGPCAGLQAESIFQKILPDEDFCPPAPNPEDIVYDGDSASSVGEEGVAGQEQQEEE